MMSVPQARTDVIETQYAPTHTGTTRARAGGVSKATDTSVIVSTATFTTCFPSEGILSCKEIFREQHWLFEQKCGQKSPICPKQLNGRDG